MHLRKIFNVHVLLLLCENFEELVAKYKSKRICHGFQTFLENDYILVLYLNLADSIPEVKASVRVKRNMSLEILYKKSIVEMRHVSHLLNGKQTVTFVTQLCNIPAAVKSWVTGEGSIIRCLNLYELVLIVMNALYSNVCINV